MTPRRRWLVIAAIVILLSILAALALTARSGDDGLMPTRAAWIQPHSG